MNFGEFPFCSTLAIESDWMGCSPPMRSKRGHLKVATHPRFPMSAKKLAQQSATKGATPKPSHSTICRVGSSVLLALCVLFSYSSCA